MQKIVPNLWFDTEAEEAANFYLSVFESSRILKIAHYNEAVPAKAGQVMTVEWEIAGQRFIGINGGPQFQFDEAVSFQVSCDDQEEIDYYWERLAADGGKEGQCGWVTDRYGLCWQVVPSSLEEIYAGADRERATRTMAAMLKMGKLDVEALRAAADGTEAD
ncbi:MAG: VOC family protein [Solirubrobacterales bacterium]